MHWWIDRSIDGLIEAGLLPRSARAKEAPRKHPSGILEALWRHPGGILEPRELQEASFSQIITALTPNARAVSHC